MTISKERLNEIALEVAEELPCCMNHIPFDAGVIWDKQEITNFAHALLKRVESECEVVTERIATNSGANWWWNNTDLPKSTKLIALPLVEGD